MEGLQEREKMMNLNQLLAQLIRSSNDSSITRIPIYFKDGQVYKPILEVKIGTIGYDISKETVIILSSETK